MDFPWISLMNLVKFKCNWGFGQWPSTINKLHLSKFNLISTIIGNWRDLKENWLSYSDIPSSRGQSFSFDINRTDFQTCWKLIWGNFQFDDMKEIKEDLTPHSATPSELRSSTTDSSYFIRFIDHLWHQTVFGNQSQPKSVVCYSSNPAIRLSGFTRWLNNIVIRSSVS